MARTQNPNSANSQFFIMFAPGPSLDGQYTIWGRVTSGMELVDKIKRGAGSSGSVRNPDRIVQMRPADVPEHGPDGRRARLDRRAPRFPSGRACL